MTHSYEEKFCVADNALLLIATEIMKFNRGEQTLSEAMNQTTAIIMAYREVRIGEFNEEE